MDASRLQQRIKWMLVTALVTIAAIAAPVLWVEVTTGGKPGNVFREHDQLRAASEQVRLEINYLAVILAGNENPATPEVQRKLDNIDASLMRGMRQIEEVAKSGFFSAAWRQLSDSFEQRFRPALLAFRKPGDADPDVVRGQLKSSRDEFESLIGRLDRTAREGAERTIKDSSATKITIAATCCFLALLAFPVLVVQRANLQRAVVAFAEKASTVKTVVDPKTSEDLLKVAGRVKELETANEMLQSEVDKLGELASKAEALAERPVELGLEAALSYLKGRSRATLGKEGQLGIVLNLNPDEINRVQPLLQAQTEFVKLDAPVAPAPTAVQAAKPTLLIIDDDRLNRTILRSCVSELDVNIFEAENGERAWETLDSGTHVDLCLCDLMMPELDGFGFARRVHADRRFETLDIIFCTASSEKEHIAQAAEIGVKQYVLKPFNKDDVIKNVRIALDRAQSRKDPMTVAQERLGIDAESYSQLMEMLNREVTETLTFVRTALTRGQRRAAWTRINSLRGSSQMVGDEGLVKAIVSVERELERGDVFFIITELEKLEEANRRLGQVASHLVKTSKTDHRHEDSKLLEPALAEAA